MRRVVNSRWGAFKLLMTALLGQPLGTLPSRPAPVG